MFYVLFEASPHEGKEKLGEQYYKSLLPHLHEIEGFREDTFRLSPHRKSAMNVAVWDDEDAAWRWRNHENHLRAQQKGNEVVYASYRIRLGPEIKDGDQSSVSDARHHLTLPYRSKAEGTPPDDVLEVIESRTASQLKDDVADSFVYQGEDIVWVTSWKSADAAMRFQQSLKNSSDSKVIRISVGRDYTKTERKDAPHETPGMT